MTGAQIISRYQLLVDDASELSSTEELDLLNEVYGEIQDDRPWEWLRGTATGTTSTSVPYIALPVDFKHIMPNQDNESVVFVGTDFVEYKVVSYSRRREFRNQDGFVYIDIPNFRLYFTLQPITAKAIEYEYIKVAAALTTATSPLFRAGLHSILAYAMAERLPSIEQADKITSYAPENQVRKQKILSEMATEDAQLKLAIA